MIKYNKTFEKIQHRTSPANIRKKQLQTINYRYRGTNSVGQPYEQ